MKWKIPLFKIYWDKEDVRAITDAVRAGMYWATGPNVEKLEELIASYVGTKYAAVFNSGTSALHATMIAYDIKQGDEIIVPSFTFIATANAPFFVGAKPVFADIEEKTFGLDPDDVKNKITKKTRAIIPMHYGGCSCLIRELKEIAEDHGILLIEDSAEAFGAKAEERNTGTFGNSSIFSFCANKVITTGEGGCIVTDSEKVDRKLKLIRSHGRLETKNYFYSAEYMDYVTLGYNFRMSNITAALGIAQIKKADKVIEMRRSNAEYMNKELSKIEEITIPNTPDNYFHVYQMYTIRVKHGKEKRDALEKFLTEKKIMTKIFFMPVHLTQFYKRLGYKIELPITEKIAAQVLTLPLYPILKREEMDYIIESINSFFHK